MPARLKDIARDLGVSVVTVSKVLRNHEDISTETRERVLKRIQELNYEPNPAARALVTGKTHLAGLIVPDLVHPFFSQLGKGVSRVLRQKKYALVISSSEEDPELERQEILQMVARRLDVLMIASTQWSAESFRTIEERQRRYVLVDRKFEGLSANFVGTDDVAVGSIATEHLISIGCQRIAHIGARHVSTAVDRLAGYRQALAAANRPASDQYIVYRSHVDDAGDRTGYEAMKSLLDVTPRPDGVFCYNDPLAMGAMQCVLDAGLRIPEDIAIVGAGNVQYASSLRIPLTSVDQDSEQLGERTAQLALQLVATKSNPEPEQILLQPRLMIRQSTRRT